MTAQQQTWFTAWWEIVWVKVGRGAAEKVFGVMVRDEATFDAVMKATADQYAFYAAKERQYQPHPATWLNQKRWMDDPATYRPQAKLLDPFADVPYYTPKERAQ